MYACMYVCMYQSLGDVCRLKFLVSVNLIISDRLFLVVYTILHHHALGDLYFNIPLILG